MVPRRLSGQGRASSRIGALIAARNASVGVRRGAVAIQRPGMSAFALEDGIVYHAYSAYARGLDGLWGMCQWLDPSMVRERVLNLAA